MKEKVYDFFAFGLLMFQRYKPTLYMDNLYPEKYLRKRINELEEAGELPEWVNYTYFKWEIDRDKRLEQERAERIANKAPVQIQTSSPVIQESVSTPSYLGVSAETNLSEPTPEQPLAKA